LIMFFTVHHAGCGADLLSGGDAQLVPLFQFKGAAGQVLGPDTRSYASPPLPAARHRRLGDGPAGVGESCV
jgi:hypothetical protein